MTFQDRMESFAKRIRHYSPEALDYTLKDIKGALEGLEPMAIEHVSDRQCPCSTCKKVSQYNDELHAVVGEMNNRKKLWKVRVRQMDFYRGDNSKQIMVIDDAGRMRPDFTFNIYPRRDRFGRYYTNDNNGRVFKTVKEAKEYALERVKDAV